MTYGSRGNSSLLLFLFNVVLCYKTLDVVSHQLKDAKYFSVFDATKGFFHLPLSARSRLLTAVLTPEGIYVWRCMEHLALWVYRGHSSLVLWPFLGNLWWVCFGCGASEAHHLIFECYAINGHCDIICDVTVLYMHWSHDLLL